jgi:hypothetical protein
MDVSIAGLHGCIHAPVLEDNNPLPGRKDHHCLLSSVFVLARGRTKR